MANTLNLGDGNWATKEDSLLGYNSENNNYKPLPFDFSRASSATRVNKEGLIETVGSGQARIDFKDNTKGSLLLEPTRSNLVLTSASGTYQNPPASETNTISPDGTNNAVIPTPDGNSDRYGYSISSGAYETNTKLAYSWYRKRISTPINTSYIGDLYMNALVNVTQVGSTTQIESDINGFDRFQAIFNITDGSASSTIRAYFGSVIGAGNSSIAYWGHQLEQGSYATSYIPTNGSTVTRVAETCNNAGDVNTFNSEEGVLYTKISGENTGEFRYISISDGSILNYVSIGYTDTLNEIFCRYYVGGSGVQFIHTLDDMTELNKIAIKWKENDFALWVNGIEVDTDLSGSVHPPNTFDTLNFARGVSNSPFYGNLSELIVFNESLSNEQLQALTS